ncbi:MAG: DUF1538 domain-containing protein [Burkholderiaceae bacterium]|nr:DUF1538 domain-containing protein [Burkholderiaceae bacterium]
MFLQLPVKEVSRILTGTLVASAGLFLFLLGVSIAFLPFGRAIGEALGALPRQWLVVPFGLLLGFATTGASPRCGSWRTRSRKPRPDRSGARWCS